jgi:CcmD family protein
MTRTAFPTLRRRARRALTALTACLAWAALPAAAFAQEFQKVEGKVGAEEVPAVPFVGIAYGFIWIAILAYVVHVARGLAGVRSELNELRRKVDVASGLPPDAKR